MSKRYSKEWREKVSKNHADVSGSNNPMFGKKRPQSVRDAISKARKGVKHTNYKPPMQGKKHSEEAKLKIGLSQKGNKSNNWKGGITILHRAIRNTAKYKAWRKSILELDVYACRECGKKAKVLHVDHIIPFAWIISVNSIKTIDEAKECSFLWNKENGRTLCIGCHMNTDSWGFKTRRMIKVTNYFDNYMGTRAFFKKLKEEKKVFLTSNGI